MRWILTSFFLLSYLQPYSQSTDTALAVINEHKAAAIMQVLAGDSLEDVEIIFPKSCLLLPISVTGLKNMV